MKNSIERENAILRWGVDKEVVAFRPALARSLNSPLAALFLCQGIYWQGIVGEGQWFYKLRDAQKDDEGCYVAPSHASEQSWEYELGMSRAQQETARTLLVRAGLLEVELRGVPAKNYYRFNLEKIRDFIVGHGSQLDGGNQPTGRRKSTSRSTKTSQQGGED